MRNKNAFALAGVLLFINGQAMAEAPLSVIDWLSESVALPSHLDADGVPFGEEAATESASIEVITSQPLDAPNPDAVGLLPSSVTGLPSNLWESSSSAALVRLIRQGSTETLPAIAELNRSLLLAEASAPNDADGSGALLLARVDQLLELGALDDAQALLERAGPTTPELFRRWFDVALLTGTENLACEALRSNGDIAPTYQARIFCLARNGDWNAAALTLNSAEALGYVAPEEYDLIARFLDPELFEGEPPLSTPSRPSPLVFRMLEAIGEPISSSTLPRAFAQADLRPSSGWKARLEAAERLARVGAIPANQLLGIYTERSPAASGGVWNRVDALQRFDLAVKNRDAEAIDQVLPVIWREMQRVGLERPFAKLYANELDGISLAGRSAGLAFHLGLLSDSYETLSRAYSPINDKDKFLSALATGAPASAPAPSAMAEAIRDGFDSGELSDDLSRKLADNRLGEAILIANQMFNEGAAGDLEKVSRALRFYRAVGLEDIARKAALQLMLMERHG